MPNPVRETAIIVEDDPKLADNMQFILQGLGYEVRGKYLDANSALREMERSKTPIDYLFVDINLPGGMNGVQLVSKLGMDAVTIYVTGNVSDDIFDHASTTNPYGFIPKPFRKVDIEYALKMAKLRKKHETGLRNLTEEMKSRNKLLQLGEFSGTIVHDLNNYNFVIGSSFSKIRKLTDRYEKQDAVAIRRHSERGMASSKMIASMSSYYKNIIRGSDEDMTEISLKSIIEDTLGHCYDRLKEKNIRTSVNVSEKLLVSVRKTLFSQCLMNLLSNSINAIQNLNERWIKIEVIPQGGHILLKFVDSGPGVPEEIRDKIFDEFFSTKHDIGLGYGLSFVKKTLNHMDIEIFLDENSPRTTFILTIGKGTRN